MKPTACSSPGIACLAVLTNQRPEELTRALQTYCESAQELGRPMQVLIADGASREDDRLDTKAVVANASKKVPLPFVYAGFQEKILFVNQLLAVCDVPRDVIEFGLFGSDHSPIKTGANRNAILLHTVGQLILSVDDDSICRVGTLTDKATWHTLTLGGQGDDAAFWLFPDRASALQAMKPVAINLFTEHERVLGKSLENLRGEYGADAVAFSNPCPHLVSSLARNAGEVAVTFSGVIGDCGMHSIGKLAMHRGNGTRRRLVNYGHTYGDLMTCREIGRQWLSTTICHVSAPMTTATGMDNRALLPPFFPICRNQDEIFCQTLKRSLRDAHFGHVPSTLIHSPAHARANHSEWASAIRISDLILECISAWPEPTGSASERLKSLGQYITDMGRLPASDFNDVFRRLLYNKASRLLGRLEKLLQGGECQPDFWRRDLNHQRMSLQNAMVEPASLIPYDLVLAMPNEQIQPVVQTLLVRFGQLLCWWPEIMAATSSLSERGVHLGQAVV